MGVKSKAGFKGSAYEEVIRNFDNNPNKAAYR